MIFKKYYLFTEIDQNWIRDRPVILSQEKQIVVEKYSIQCATNFKAV